MLKNLKKLLFPEKCMVCGDVTLLNIPFCGECLKSVFPLFGEACPGCGKEHNQCRCCGNSGFLFYYHSPVSKRIILSLKHRYDKSATEFFGRMIFLAMSKEIKYDCIIFPPRTAENIKKYGFDQMENIAAEVGKQLNIPVCKAIKRSRRAKEQKLLSASQRRKNTLGLFQANPEELKNYSHILLLDDVRTTGSTLLACKNALHKAGVKSVSVFTIAKTPPLRLKNKKYKKATQY